MIADVIITTWFIEVSLLIVLSVTLGFMLGVMATLRAK
jgi:hypothetical protein